jgi:branched-subunit amino acid transport protein
MNWALFFSILGMVVVTYGLRLSFLVFGHKLAFPQWLERCLRYVPTCVLTALIVPMTLAPKGAIDFSLRNPYLSGALICAIVAFFSRNALAAILLGFFVFALFRYYLN